MSAVAGSLNNARHHAKAHENKSFLVLFFKKEPLAFTSFSPLTVRPKLTHFA